MPEMKTVTFTVRKVFGKIGIAFILENNQGLPPARIDYLFTPLCNPTQLENFKKCFVSAIRDAMSNIPDKAVAYTLVFSQNFSLEGILSRQRENGKRTREPFVDLTLPITEQDAVLFYQIMIEKDPPEE